MKRTLLLALALAFLVSPTLGIKRASAATTATKYLNGKIVFYTDDNAIYTANADGSNPTKQTDSSVGNSGPSWSSDGNKIAFTNNYEIYTMNADGSNQTNLTNNSAGDNGASWSRDGSKIAFVSQRDGNSEIYTMNADGSNETRLTNNSDFDSGPVWSPDGTKILYYNSANADTFVMNADGSNKVNLTNSSGSDYGAVWSHDGTKIAFYSTRSGMGDVYVMNADGSNLTNISNDPQADYSPDWSPDDSKITFISYRGNNQNVYTVNPDGSGLMQITNTPDQQEDSAVYSPDGKKFILTVEDADWNSSEVYSMNIDGTGLTQLTNGGGYTAAPAYNEVPWQPLPYTQTTNDDGTTTSTISSDKDYSSGEYTVANNETLIVDGAIGSVTVESGGILEGTGTVGTATIESGGTIAPGHSPGCINSGNLTLSGTYQAQIGGTTACSGYDQLQVTGTVDLTGSTLTTSLVNSFVPSAGQSFTIIDNDSTDAVTGTFTGLAEGSTFTSQGITYRVSYVGGTGNDVTLTVTSINAAQLPSAPDTGLKMITASPAIALLATVLVGGGLAVIGRSLRAQDVVD